MTKELELILLRPMDSIFDGSIEGPGTDRFENNAPLYRSSNFILKSSKEVAGHPTKETLVCNTEKKILLTSSANRKDLKSSKNNCPHDHDLRDHCACSAEWILLNKSSIGGFLYFYCWLCSTTQEINRAGQSTPQKASASRFTEIF